jgi:hypothetical protein
MTAAGVSAWKSIRTQFLFSEFTFYFSEITLDPGLLCGHIAPIPSNKGALAIVTNVAAGCGGR